MLRSAAIFFRKIGVSLAHTSAYVILTDRNKALLSRPTKAWKGHNPAQIFFIYFLGSKRGKSKVAGLLPKKCCDCGPSVKPPPPLLLLLCSLERKGTFLIGRRKSGLARLLYCTSTAVYERHAIYRM